MSKYRSDYEPLVAAFKALAHPVRLVILEAVRRNCCLAEGASADVQGYHVGDIYEAVDVAPSTVSHHLKELKRAGLVVERRAGKFAYLTLGHDRLGELVAFAVGQATQPQHRPALPKEEGMSCCEPPTPTVTRSSTTTDTIALRSHPPSRIRPATAADRTAVEALLAAASLPLAGLDDATLFVAEDAGSRRVSGTAGLEVWGRHGLLRSLVVAPERQGKGLGHELAVAVETEARRVGLASLAVLTTTAADFFARLGYATAPRDGAPRSLRASAEWSENVCPDGAAYLAKDLRTIAPGDVHGIVRERYAAVARTGSSCGTGTGTSCGCGDTAALGYDQDALAAIPAGADLGLGCGAPLELARPVAGETVVDLGSGGGLDALLAARAVGPTGRVIGVDMTPEMLARARRAAATAGATQVEFREGQIERMPIADGEADLVISNCVINLSPDKPAVFAEAFRVLKPGGRMVVSDIVTEGELPEAVRNDPMLYGACVGGASSRESYLAAIRAAGFARVDVLKEVPFAAFPEFGVKSITYRATKA